MSATDPRNAVKLAACLRATVIDGERVWLYEPPSSGWDESANRLLQRVRQLARRDPRH